MSNFNFSSLVVTSNDIARFRKDNGFYRSLVLVGAVDFQIKEYATIRFYRTKTRNYACFWMHNEYGFGQVGAVAGGYGYDREEAALSSAARLMGITGDWFDAKQFLKAFADHLHLVVYDVIEAHS